MQKGRWTQEITDLQVNHERFSAVTPAYETAQTTPPPL
jgi:hypothetical protein